MFLIIFHLSFMKRDFEEGAVLKILLKYIVRGVVHVTLFG
jgi:hypothetical protein